MPRRILTLTAAVFALAAAPAAAMPAPTFSTTQTAAGSFTFDASSTVCPFGFCGYSWRGYGPTSNRLGFRIGNGPVVRYTFAPGVYSVVLTFSQRGSPFSSRWCPSTASTSVAAT